MSAHPHSKPPNKRMYLFTNKTQPNNARDTSKEEKGGNGKLIWTYNQMENNVYYVYRRRKRKTVTLHSLLSVPTDVVVVVEVVVEKW